MSKARNDDLPQHHLQQGHYGDLSLDELPEATGYPSGSAFLWDGTGWYLGTVSLSGSPGGPGTDEKVKVSSNDTTADYLVPKLSGTSGVNLHQYNDGGNEILVLSGSTRYAGLNVIIGNGSDAISLGVKGSVEVPFECYVVRAAAFADQTGIAVVDIWRDVYTNYIPNDSDSITSTTPLRISGTNKYEDNTLSGWGTHLLAGDILTFNVDNCVTITQVTASLRVRVV